MKTQQRLDDLKNRLTILEQKLVQLDIDRCNKKELLKLFRRICFLCEEIQKLKHENNKPKSRSPH